MFAHSLLLLSLFPLPIPPFSLISSPLLIVSHGFLIPFPPYSHFLSLDYLSLSSLSLSLILSSNLAFHFLSTSLFAIPFHIPCFPVPFTFLVFLHSPQFPILFFLSHFALPKTLLPCPCLFRLIPLVHLYFPSHLIFRCVGGGGQPATQSISQSINQSSSLSLCFCLSVWLRLALSSCACLCLSESVGVSLCVCACVCLSLSVCLLVCLSVCLFVCLFACLFANMFTHTHTLRQLSL